MRAAEAARAIFSSYIYRPFCCRTRCAVFAVAVSGGSDSMALLQWRKSGEISAGVMVSAVTVDHGLRAQSAEEAMQVSTWAAQIGVPHSILKWQGEKPQTGIQAAARTARYNLMTHWASDNGVDCLFTGHTLNDQAETVAMRLKRTTSAASIAGIRPEIMWNQVRVLRPLLHVKREALRDMLRAVGQDWIDDPSNDDPVFERVRTRREIGGDAETLAGLADSAQLRLLRAEAEAQQFALQHVTEHPEGYFSVERNGIMAVSDEAADHLLQQLMRSLGGSVALLDERQRLWDWLKAKGGNRRTLGGVVVAQRLREILFMREPTRINRGECLVPESGTLVWDGRFAIAAVAGSRVVPAGKISRFGALSGLPRTVLDGLPVLVPDTEGAVAAPAAPHSGLSLRTLFSGRFLGLR